MLYICFVFAGLYRTHHPYTTGTPLHNLPILLITHSALNGKAPQCSTDLLTPYIPARNLRSEGKGYLVALKTLTKTPHFRK